MTTFFILSAIASEYLNFCEWQKEDQFWHLENPTEPLSVKHISLSPPTFLSASAISFYFRVESLDRLSYGPNYGAMEFIRELSIEMNSTIIWFWMLKSHHSDTKWQQVNPFRIRALGAWKKASIWECLDVSQHVVLSMHSKIV